MPGPESSIVVVGAGQAGVQIADSLRQEGHKGPITLIGEEHYPPYQRPPLSKDYLAGAVVESQLFLRTPEMLARKEITLITSARVEGVDLAARRIALSDGRAFRFEGLALATGCRARPLPVAGASLAGVLTLRGIDDTKRIAESLSVASKVVVIGGGFIGLEIAGTARSVGKDVTVLEGADRLMSRAVSPVISEHFLAIHRARGAHIELGAKVIGLTGKAGHVTSVETADGKSWPADVVVIGIGIIPGDDLGRAIGLACDNGIIVDACSRTSEPAIVAAGDCTARRIEDGRLLRLESVQNAVEQGKSAAAALMGRERPFVAAPWFWSDQYEEKLQMAGLSAGYDQIVIRGAQESASFSAFYFRDGKLLGSDSVNQPKDHMATRRMLDKKVNPTPEQTADVGFNFQTLLK
jgi:3-phenylpropionate/trans-cinnamate dioxygenase ferredoxin reductase subunit